MAVVIVLRLIQIVSSLVLYKRQVTKPTIYVTRDSGYGYNKYVQQPNSKQQARIAYINNGREYSTHI